VGEAGIRFEGTGYEKRNNLSREIFIDSVTGEIVRTRFSKSYAGA
jgi:hypothetical protein